MKICIDCKIQKNITEFKRRKKGYFSSYCRNCENIRLRNWASNNKDKMRASRKKSRLKLTYKLSEKEFENLLLKQNNLCAVCNANKATDIDHDHACCPTIPYCGKCIRGIVCSRCNILLGWLESDKNVQQLAVVYLYNYNRSRKGAE